jgi:hypothetical protein
MIAPIRLATTISTASAVPESADLEEPKLCIQIMLPDEEWELRNTDEEMVDGESADNSEDKDY